MAVEEEQRWAGAVKKEGLIPHPENSEVRSQDPEQKPTFRLALSPKKTRSSCLFILTSDSSIPDSST